MDFEFESFAYHYQGIGSRLGNEERERELRER